MKNKKIDIGLCKHSRKIQKIKLLDGKILKNNKADKKKRKKKTVKKKEIETNKNNKKGFCFY